MIQIGWNLGPRHARVLGLAKSYSKILDQKTAVEHDEDAIGLLAIMWGLVKGLMPSDVTTEVIETLHNISAPQMGSRLVEPGKPSS